jgi:Fe-S cluster assembly protein SufD
VATASQALQNLEETFSRIVKSAASREPAWLRTLRQRGFDRFSEMGFPTTHDEDWRFTNISAIVQTNFQLNGSGNRLPTSHQIKTFRVAGAASQLVFVDGRFSLELSSLGKLPKGITVANLAAQIASPNADGSQALEPYLGRYLNIQRDSFSALNTAFIEDGAFIHIAKGAVLEAPIHLLFVSTAHDVPVMVHPRNLIVAEEGSRATVIEDYMSLGGAPSLCNTATELIAADNAIVSHYMIEREDTQAFNISTLRIEQGRSANISSHSVLIGGALVRNNIHPVLAGDGGECLINGLFIGNGRQHLDNYMLVEHAKPHCGSRQFYNGILDGQSHGVFHGRIVVHKDAQKTDAKQTNRNLLLSDQAQIDTKPQLEIYADDVKCTHGATIGQMEENALFYLRSRGIEEVSARRLLLMAFASECLDRMQEGPARSHVEALIHAHLATIAKSSAGFSRAPHPAGAERNLEEVG